MRGRVLVFAVAAATGLCGCRSPEVRPTEDPPPTGPALDAGAGGTGGITGHLGASGGPLSGLMLPPGTPGESLTRFEGCLAQAEATEAAGARFPSRARSRGAPAGPAAQVSTVSGGVLITHELSHACCLTAKVTSEVLGTKVTVQETLSGSPCRCLCQSTVRTSVGLSKGHYQLSLVQASGGAATSVLETEIDVP